MDIVIIQISTVFTYMNLWFLAAIIKKRNDLADIAWGLGFVLLAMTGWIANPTTRTIVVLGLVSVWGLRLASHIAARFKKKAEEDFRYKKWREEWGKSWIIKSWLRVFMLQGLMMVLVSASIIITGGFDQGGWNFVNSLGVVIWIIGFFFEAVGDWQLKRFVRQPENKGKIMQSGLWRYSRHPNYFGEVTMWWGIWLISWGAPYFLLAAISPLTISFLILKVSGIPMLEKKYRGRQDFESYRKRTNAFFPWFPKKYAQKNHG